MTDERRQRDVEFRKKTSLPVSLCCHVGEGSEADEEGLVAFT